MACGKLETTAQPSQPPLSRTDAVGIHRRLKDEGMTTPIKLQASIHQSLLITRLVTMSSAPPADAHPWSRMLSEATRPCIHETLSLCVLLMCRNVGALPIVIVMAVAWLSW